MDHPVPHGFSHDDVNLDAKRLFSDSFMLLYLKYMAIMGTTNYDKALSMCPRSDVREIFTYALSSVTKLSNKADDLLLAKGLYIRAPIYPFPRE